MSTKQDVQKVNIDTYFSELDDHAQPIDPRIHNPKIKAHTQRNRDPLSLKNSVIISHSTESPILQPYRNQRSMLVENRDFSVFELETAYGAVCKLRELLQSDQDEFSITSSPPVNLAINASHRPKANLLAKILQISVALIVIAVVINTSRPYASDCLSKQCYSPLVNKLLAAVKPLGEIAGINSLEELQKAKSTADNRYFSDSLKHAQAAAEMTQRAQTTEDWRQVIYLWQLALNNLKPISSTSPLHSKAQAKEAIYRRNLSYSRQELEMTPFREGVKAAEEASRLAAEASSEKDWQIVADKWQTALTKMQAVANSSKHYPIAQSKLVEYSTKFAYTQKRYLDSQVSYPQ